MFCRVLPDFRNPNHLLGIMAADWLRPHVKSGRLELWHLPSAKADDHRLRLVYPGDAPGTVHAVYDAAGDVPLLKRLFSDRLLIRRHLPADPLEACGPVLVDINKLDPPETFRRRAYRAGERRDLASDFSFLAQGGVTGIVVRDPYLFHSPDAAAALETLLQLWKNLIPGGLPAATQFYFAEENHPQKRQTCDTVLRDFRKQLPALGISEARTVPSRSRPGQDFHDRRIDFTLIKPVGAPKLLKKSVKKPAADTAEQKRITVELSGGIYRLVAPEKECCLYVFEA